MIRRWGRVISVFVAASAFQVLMYAPVWPGRRSFLSISEIAGGEFGYIAFVSVLFFFGPGLAAAIVAMRMLRRAYTPTGGVPPFAIALVVVLAFVSCYAGVVISFNTWGT
jgi:hypothetical protein